MHQTYGTVGAPSPAAYDEDPTLSELYPAFYAWAAKVVEAAVPKNAALLDAGCGTGRLLAELTAVGYERLSGCDFAGVSLDRAATRVPDAEIFQADLMAGLGKRTFDAIVCSEVIEHVAEPVVTLRNLHAALRPGGVLILTYPNPLAFWPLLHLWPIVRRLPKGRLRHWGTWFTTPYEMYSTQPLDHAYRPKSVRGFLAEADFTIQREEGFRRFPMLRIPDIPWTARVTDAVERGLSPVLPKRLCYRYAFVCSSV